MSKDIVDRLVARYATGPGTVTSGDLQGDLKAAVAEIRRLRTTPPPDPRIMAVAVGVMAAELRRDPRVVDPVGLATSSCLTAVTGIPGQTIEDFAQRACYTAAISHIAQELVDALTAHIKPTA